MGWSLRKRWRSRRPIAKHAPHAFLDESGIPYVAAHLGSRPAMGAQSIQDLLSCKRIRRLDMPEVVFLLSAGERFGLPLGLSADTTYAESVFLLAPSDQLTLLTDGVVEARNKTGVLFGFERSAALSSRSAEAIASAAQAFGQAGRRHYCTDLEVCSRSVHCLRSSPRRNRSVD